MLRWDMCWVRRTSSGATVKTAIARAEVEASRGAPDAPSDGSSRSRKMSYSGMYMPTVGTAASSAGLMPFHNASTPS